MTTPPPPIAGPASPCVRNCCLDDDNVCLGCGRSLDEIMGWSAASDAEKRAILERCGRRAEQRRQRQDARARGRDSR